MVDSDTLLIHADGSLLWEQFVSMVKKSLQTANLNVSCVLDTASELVPHCKWQQLGCWESEAYQLYIRTPWASLAAASQLIAE